MNNNPLEIAIDIPFFRFDGWTDLLPSFSAALAFPCLEAHSHRGVAFFVIGKSGGSGENGISLGQ